VRSAKSYDDYLSQHPKWHDGIELLRKALLECNMSETIKWGAPVYTFNNKNVASIGAFKNHLALWIYQGSLLKDKKKLLVQVQENTKAMRHLRYHANDEIDVAIVKAYCLESIENFKNGLEIKPERKKKALIIPNELQVILEDNASVKDSFNALTEGKKREYAEYITLAKQAKTKANRIAKILPLIQSGQGLNDRYKR